MWSGLHTRIYDEEYKKTPQGLAARCLHLGGYGKDVFDFAEGLGIGIILNSQMARRVPFLALKGEKSTLKYYGYKDDPEESRIYYDQKEDKWYILINDAYSRGTQREIIAYDIARIVLLHVDEDYGLNDWEKHEREDVFVSYLLPYLKDYDEPETPDELVVEVVED